VESGRGHINENVRITVTSVLQTSAGRMIFGRFEQTVAPSGSSRRESAHAGTSRRSGASSSE
jgi:hypothetical protein